MAMIPRMANLTTLKIHTYPCPFEEFISTFKDCLQQSSIEQLYLYGLYEFPLSVLDNGKCVKKLMLSDCTEAEEPISSPPSSQHSLETLILYGDYIPDLAIWASHRVTRLTSLSLQGPLSGNFSELLTQCSSSLTTLHLDIDYDCMRYPSVVSVKFTYFPVDPSVYLYDGEPYFHGLPFVS